jgi:hypothetical protein
MCGTMSSHKKYIVLIGALLSYVLFAADVLDKAKRLYEAPSTALTFWGIVRSVASDTTPMAWVIFGVGTACFLLGTADWWRPRIMAIRAAMNDKGAAPVTSKPPPAPPPETISLLEAATQAYEQARARGALSAGVAEIDWRDAGGGRLQDDTLTWYCCALGDRIDIYGNHPPSRQPEKISWQKCKNTHSFEIVDGNLIFKERHSRAYFENLHVKTADLSAALQSVEAMG